VMLLGACGTSSHSSTTPEEKPDAASADSVVVNLQDFDVPAGKEVYKCENFPNPFGSAVDIDRFESHMPVGSHHMIVFFMDGSPDAGGGAFGDLEDCSGAEFHPNVFGAQTPDSVIDLPKGIGVAVPAATWLRVQLHFINLSEKDATAGVTMRFHVAKPGAVTQHAGQLLFSNEDITVQPHSQGSATKTCTVPSDISLLGVSSHMHSHATEFVATTAGTTLYETKSWSDAVPNRFEPPFPLPANQDVTFTCSYTNDTATLVQFGQSAITDEMCILGGIYYPVADVTSPNVVCF
jgi:hypothetical protein